MTTPLRRVLQLVVGLAIAVAVFLVSRGGGETIAPVVPEVQSQFSLDLKVIDSADVDVIYMVEQRSRPAYRIFSFDARTGEDETIFSVPENAIIYGLALSPDGGSLAVSYTQEYALDGNGLWIFDLESAELTEVVAAQTDLYLTEPEFAADGNSVFVTYVDRKGEDEELSIAKINLETGDLEVVLPNAITPAVDGDDLYFLTVDDQKARRSIGVWAPGKDITAIEVADSSLDLDHLVVTEGGATSASAYVAVLEAQSEPTVTIGEPAGAHGNHNVRSMWWGFESTKADSASTEIESIIVYDASATADGTIVYATLEGLSIATEERVDLIASRAIRFIAS